MLKILAHRGACREAPENTLGAFRRAIELGADGVELDVHHTRDGALVVHHDAAAPEIGQLGDRTVAEIRAVHPDVPTLPDALDCCVGRLVNIEIKNLPGTLGYDPDQRAAVALVELLDERGHRDEVLVSSFGIDTIDRVRGLDHEVPTALLTMAGFDQEELLVVAHGRGHGAINPDVRALGGDVAEELVARAHAARMAVYPWTVDDPDEIRRLAGAGVDGVITNVPDVARVAVGG